MTAELVRESLVTPEEYLRGEELAETKHEYLNGVVHAMAGATADHNRIVLAIAASLRTRLRVSGCEVFAMDLKTKIDADGDVRFYYPDDQVVCGRPAGHVLVHPNPAMVVEILSDSTRRIDQGEKLQGYLKLPSLQLYLLVETELPFVIAHRRAGDLFTRETYTGMDAVIPLPFLKTELPLAEIYEDIVFNVQKR